MVVCVDRMDGYWCGVDLSKQYRHGHDGRGGDWSDTGLEVV